jgi:hypothetical protein
MTTVTQTDYAGMSWHQRQTLNDRLRAETTQLRHQLEHLNAPEIRRQLITQAECEVNFAAAKTILDQLPADPLAAQHRVALDQDLAHRSGDWR